MMEELDDLYERMVEVIHDDKALDRYRYIAEQVNREKVKRAEEYLEWVNEQELDEEFKEKLLGVLKQLGDGRGRWVEVNNRPKMKCPHCGESIYERKKELSKLWG